mmetsp:Transcript_22599/g.40435  ORF Transcript_22599/g.40435 Transcript_22599/m.40435 type:complete len:354 (-) Transcript_22599:148-1209(-)
MILPIPSISSTWMAVGLCAVMFMGPSWLQARDEALLLAYPPPPIPNHGSIITIQHSNVTMEKIAVASDLPIAALASSFDMYFEAQLEDCDPDKNVVVVGGTNGASWLMNPAVEGFRKKGYCTLNFDHRAHGRSSVPPGELTAELLGEDAAVIIHRVFGGKPVHVVGWSLGGAISYYLGIEHPQLVRSITMSGMTSCFSGVLADGNCDLSFDFMKWFFSRDFMLRLLGTELSGLAASAALNMHPTDANMFFWRTLSPSTMVRTPQTWGRWRKNYYHEAIRQIKVPVLLLAGEHDALIGVDEASMREDVERVAGPAEFVIFPGFSHFIFFEEYGGERGADLISSTTNDFHAKHFS